MSLSHSKFINRRLPARAAGFIFLAGMTATPAAFGLTINANLTDLPNSIVGQDLWQASYSLSSNTPFLTNEGFTVLFDPSLYANLSTPLLPTPPGWDVLSVQPDVALSAPGFLDGLALINTPTLSQPFNLNFVWKGSVPPTVQPFETYSLNGGFHITGSGQTIVGSGPIIPEIGFGFGTGWLLAAFAAVSRGRRLPRVTTRKAS